MTKADLEAYIEDLEARSEEMAASLDEVRESNRNLEIKVAELKGAGLFEFDARLAAYQERVTAMAAEAVALRGKLSLSEGKREAWVQTASNNAVFANECIEKVKVAEARLKHMSGMVESNAPLNWWQFRQRWRR